jgi:F-type H+-transporting ATPase subunit a
MMNPMSQFQVNKLVPISLFGLDFSITNSSIFMIIAVALFAFISYMTLSRSSVRIGYMNAAMEVSYKMVQNIVKENIGDNANGYTPLVFAVFMYVFFGNMLGMIPYCFAFTSQIIVTFGLAVIVFLFSVFVGIWKHGIGFLRTFLPAGVPLYIAPLLVPIEIISFLSRPFSLAIRLFANIVAGHAMMKVFAIFAVSLGAVFGLFPFCINVILTVFEFVVAFLQAYIFAVLASIYLSSAIHLH